MKGDLTKIIRRAVGAAARRIADGHHHDGEEKAGEIVHGYERKFAARLAAAAKEGGRLTLDHIAEQKRAGTPYEVAIEKWGREHAARKIVQIGATLRRAIARLVLGGVRNGDPNPSIARNIRDVLGGIFAARRAERIARTETHTATQLGASVAAKSTGLDLVKSWAAVEDARTRPDHSAADGQTVELDDYFIVGGVHMKFPGDPSAPPGQTVNCRCVALYVPRDT